MAKRNNNSGISVFLYRGDSRKTRRLQRLGLVLGKKTEPPTDRRDESPNTQKDAGLYRKHNQDKSRGQTKEHGNEKAHMEDGAVSCNVGDASEDKIAHCDAAYQGVQGDMVSGEYAQLLPRH